LAKLVTRRTANYNNLAVGLHSHILCKFPIGFIAIREICSNYTVTVKGGV
jgi:hypothetical protein